MSGMKVEKLLLKLRLKVDNHITNSLYAQKETGAEFARKVLLENLKKNYQKRTSRRKISFVERSHQRDDFEFYIPHLLKVKNQKKDFIKLGKLLWQKV